MLPLRVLFVGDSFTYFNNLPAVVQRVANAAPGRPLRTERLTASSHSLTRHLREGRALARIRRGGLDVVVLQEEGTVPLTGLPRFEGAVGLFAREIRRAGARPLLLLTWAPQDKPWVQTPLTDANRRVGAARRVAVAPVGEAWRLWRAVPGAASLFVADGIHPAFRGSYLSALVIVGALRGRVPERPPLDFSQGLGVVHRDGDRPLGLRIDPSERDGLVRCAREALGAEARPR